MKRVFIAGATGYLGRHLCAEYQRRGYLCDRPCSQCDPEPRRLRPTNWSKRKPLIPRPFKASWPGPIWSCPASASHGRPMGSDYWDVDYQANLNLLREAERAGVARFAYIHVLHAGDMAQVPMVAAKSAFVAELQRSAVAATVIAPTGYFSDMGEILAMATIWPGVVVRRWQQADQPDPRSRSGDAPRQRQPRQVSGGLMSAVPDVFSQRDLAELAFASLGKPPRITMLPDVIRRIALRLLPIVAQRRISGPARFFLSALALDMVGDRHGTRSLEDHFADSVARTTVGARPILLPRKGRNHDDATNRRDRRPGLCRNLSLWLCPACHSAGGLGIRHECDRRR
jgi:uncharacterized protein YbjT (DUF2867 family)